MGEGDLLVELIKLLGQLIWLLLKLVWWLVRSAVKLVIPKPLASRLQAARVPAAQVVTAERPRPAAAGRERNRGARAPHRPRERAGNAERICAGEKRLDLHGIRSSESLRTKIASRPPHLLLQKKS